jgi:regulator of replication initiation timing
MTAKEYMKQARILLRRIDRKQKEADDLRQKLSLPKSSDFSDMPKTVSPEPNEIEVGVAKIMSLEEEILVFRTELDSMVAEVNNNISKLDNSDMRDLLTKRYVEFKDWKVIFSEMGYSKSSAYRLHQQALSIIKFGTSWDYVGLDDTSHM